MEVESNSCANVNEYDLQMVPSYFRFTGKCNFNVRYPRWKYNLVIWLELYLRRSPVFFFHCSTRRSPSFTNEHPLFPAPLRFSNLEVTQMRKKKQENVFLYLRKCVCVCVCQTGRCVFFFLYYCCCLII